MTILAYKSERASTYNNNSNYNKPTKSDFTLVMFENITLFLCVIRMKKKVFSNNNDESSKNTQRITGQQNKSSSSRKKWSSAKKQSSEKNTVKNTI